MSAISEKIQQLRAQIMSGEIKPKSQFHLRNEEAQEQIRVAKFGRVEKVLKKRSRLMIPMEIAIPFDPFVGAETDEYNKSSKYRPLISATSMVLMMKALANENEATKAEFMRRANVETWDTSDLENLTEEDKLVFRLYRVPRIFTKPIATINDERITGKDYPVSYAVSVERDPVTGAVIGEWPLFLQANKLYRDMAFEESKHIDKCIQDAKDGKAYELKSDIRALRGYDFADIKEKDLKDVKAKHLWTKVFVSEDRPSNYMVVYEFPLTNDLEFDECAKLANITTQEVEAKLKYVSRSKELNLAMENYRNGTYKKHDVNYDFWELDMVCPMTVEDESDKMQIGKDTKFHAPQEKVSTFEHGEKVMAAVQESLDNSKDWETRFLFSVRARKMDEDVEAKLLDVIESNNELENVFLTEGVLKSNADFISKVYGQAGDMALARLNIGVSGRAAGELDETEAAKEAKEALNVALIIDDDGEEVSVSNAAALDAEELVI